MTTPDPNAASVLHVLARHHEASRERLHLVPSENGLSLAARLPHLTEAAVRYAFPGPAGGENWAWPGRQGLVGIERDAAVRLAAQLGAQYVNLKPVSGVSALTVALSALARPGETVWNIAEADGGHGSTRFIGARLQLSMRSLPFDHARCTIDTAQLAEALRGGAAPALVYLDAFMCLFPIDLGALREAVGPETVIHYDASHTLGLIAGGAFQDPLHEGADSLGGSTHKTYPGPHKGVLATNRPEIGARLDEHASHFISHHHPADVAALAIAAVEMDEQGAAYARRTIANAKHLAAALAERGFTVRAADYGFTECHQLWIDIAPLMDAEHASRLLYEAGIAINAIPIPYVDAPAGLRLGVQEVSWAGMGPGEMDEVADVFAAVLRDRQETAPAAKRIRALIEAHRQSDASEQTLRSALALVGGAQ